MTEIVAVDIGGTHVRFATARIEKLRVVALGAPITLRTRDFPDLAHAWGAYCRQARITPRAAAIAVAAPVGAEAIELTNSDWVLHPASIQGGLNIDQHILINDFEAVGHAVAQVENDQLELVCGPDRPFRDGTISIVGPGTGLGVAHLHRAGTDYRITATEGGHIDFAPIDEFEDALLGRLRLAHERVSVERTLSGAGLREIVRTLADEAISLDDVGLWTKALEGRDPITTQALERFCRILGSVAGDIALAQGGFAGVVIAGGLGLRLRSALPSSGFAARFRAKGRFEGLMASIPVKLITHPQPGLLGAAAAFAQEHP